MNMTNGHFLFVLPVSLIIGAAVVVWLVARLVWRRARAATMRSLVSGPAARSPWRAVLLAALVAGAQWAVVAHNPEPRLLLAVLVVPALFAGASLARLIPATATVRSGRKGARR
ncbi:hypothetical protein [Kutzneria chonburiensis]|uniref:Integral membrane protein n=1 Tax=Kutzneria chonburiensis TaxID=1483604 RepID=A0ABV6N242_9PSEU|nr:hypothetical protein [Kutzneria chonburiensis]